MSYNFYSLVTSIKDKSSQAMATLSSDLKEFSSIVQEDVAEVAKTVRQTVHEQSEALRQRVEEQDGDAPKAVDSDGEKDGAMPTPKTEEEDDDDEPLAPEADDEQDDVAHTTERRSSMGSFLSFTGLSGLSGFSGLSLEAVGSKILHSADGLLDTLARAGAVEGEVDDDEDETAEDARRYRLLALQEDAHTYLHPPMDVETFKKWRKALADDELDAIKDEVLAHYPTVAEKLSELVPDSVSVDDFWAHYVYKASLLAAQEQRGADLLEHALNDSEEEVGWDAESPRHGEEKENDGRFPTFEDAHPDDPTLPILELEVADGPEPCSPAPVLGEQRAQLPEESDDDIPVSSDGESWIELDEQRRDAQQPPLSSSSSSTSSFVPVYGPRDGVYNVVGGDSKVSSTPARVREDDEEDVDWGDEDEGGDSAAAAKAAKEEDPAPATQTPETKARGPDWGEWD